MDKMIASDDVRAICLPNKTFDIAKFEPHITPAEIQHIKPFLGKSFYDLIVSEYTSETYTGLNQTLHTTYLKPALAWFTLAKAMPFMHVEIRNGGFFVNASEFSQGASNEQRASLVTVAIQNAETLLDQAKEYIEANPNSFTLYSKSGSIDNNTEIIGGIVFDLNEESE